MPGPRHLLALTLVACRPAPTATPVPAPTPTPATPTPPPTTPAAAPDPLRDLLDLSFEQGDPLAAWSTSGAPLLIDTKQAHHGARSLLLRNDQNDAPLFSASNVVPLEQARGKRVRLSGWLRLRDVRDNAGLWLRADGVGADEVLTFGFSEGVRGTADWQRREVTIDVPADATSVPFGVTLRGPGEVWFDDLAIRLEPLPVAPPVALTGVVHGPDGKPAPGASVAVVLEGRRTPAAIVQAGPDGRFAAEVPPGQYVLTAAHAAGVPVLAFVNLGAAKDVTVDLAPGGFALRGTIKLVGPAAPLRVTATPRDDGPVLHFTADPDGRFAVRLRETSAYTLALRHGDASADTLEIPGKGDRTVALTMFAAGEPPPDVVAWLRKAAVPLTTSEPGSGLEDMSRLRGLFRGARVVGLGEATHGTREFFQIKHRLLEHLVEKEGFTHFAIEASLTDARKLDDYVQGGPGTAAEALPHLGFAVWQTEELLALVEFLRRWNADPKHKQKVQLAGVDMQRTTLAWPNVQTYLARVDPDFLKSLPPSLEILHQQHTSPWTLPYAEKAALRAAADAIVARLEARRADHVRASSADEWRRAREDAGVCAQAVAFHSAVDFPTAYSLRDRAMADNVAALLAHAGPRAKVVLWAHNAHVRESDPNFMSLGSHLAARHGPAYVSVGFLWSEGGFRARNRQDRQFATTTFGPPPVADTSTAFVRAACERCVVDLRPARGDVAAWLAAPRTYREVGGETMSDRESLATHRLAREYDAVVFVRSTTPSRPLAKPAATASP